MIKTVIMCQNGTVMVFDKKGEQVPEYQVQYQEVKESILKMLPQMQYLVISPIMRLN